MADLLHDPAHWQELARSHRKMAAEATDLETRRILDGIAVAYENLTRRAELRLLRKD
jgi:hypothetical protein